MANAPFLRDTGISGKELEEQFGLDEDIRRIDLTWPADSLGNKESLGNSIYDVMEDLQTGKIEPVAGGPEAVDPPVSQAQRRAMYAAAEGHSNLGIPKSVGKDFVNAGHGVTGLPERKGRK